MSKEYIIYKENRLIHPLMSQLSFSSVVQDYLLSTLKENQVILYFFNPTQVILGSQDRRLPEFENGLKYLQSQNYPYHVRSSGGLAVVSDEGILNFTLMKKSENQDFKKDYEYLTKMINQLVELDSEVGEISNSYCPGDYDLSVNAQKFCGCSQRRIRDNVALSATLCVSGDQRQRLELIKNFYSASEADERYPQISLDSMTTVSQIKNEELSVDGLQKRMMSLISSEWTNKEQLVIEDKELFESIHRRIKMKNQL